MGGASFQRCFWLPRVDKAEIRKGVGRGGEKGEEEEGGGGRRGTEEEQRRRRRKEEEEEEEKGRGGGRIKNRNDRTLTHPRH